MAKQWPIFLWQCKAAGRSQLQQKKLTITSFFFSWKNMKLTAVCVENARKGNQTKRRCTSQQWRLHILKCWRSQLAGKPNAAAKCLVNEFQLLNWGDHAHPLLVQAHTIHEDVHITTVTEALALRVQSDVRASSCGSIAAVNNDRLAARRHSVVFDHVHEVKQCPWVARMSVLGPLSIMEECYTAGSVALHK